MKKVFLMMSIILFACVSMTVTSCSNEEERLENVTHVLQSQISRQEMKSIQQSIIKKIQTRTRSGFNELTEEEAEELLIPLYESGLSLQEQILSAIEANPSEFTNTDIEMIENLEEDQLATLGFIVAELEFENEESILEAVSSSSVKDCIAVALGISTIKNIGINGLISAKTGMQIVWQIGKRYLGYVGLAWAIWDFVDCVG